MVSDDFSANSAIARAQSRHAVRGARGTSGGHATIFVVDDEQPNLDTVTLALQEHYTVHAFLDPQLALEAVISDGCPDLIIADQRMPGLTGTALIEKVAELHPNAVGVILSGFTDRGALVAAINRAHVFAYLTKPWRAETLLDTVGSALSTIRQQQAHRQVKVGLENLKTGLGALSSSVTEGPSELQSQLELICSEVDRLASGRRRPREEKESGRND